MEEVLVRIKKICEYEEVSREQLAKQTGVPFSRWHNLLNSRGKIRSEEIAAVGGAWPEYRLWLAFGDEMPDAGQVSPMTKVKLQKGL